MSSLYSAYAERPLTFSIGHLVQPVWAIRSGFSGSIPFSGAITIIFAVSYNGHCNTFATKLTFLTDIKS
jgi:hypothetical protein